MLHLFITPICTYIYVTYSGYVYYIKKCNHFYREYIQIISSQLYYIADVYIELKHLQTTHTSFGYKKSQKKTPHTKYTQSTHFVAFVVLYRILFWPSHFCISYLSSVCCILLPLLKGGVSSKNYI